jgi:glycosyltransferase involved in cell wall biosynthesis
MAIAHPSRRGAGAARRAVRAALRCFSPRRLAATAAFLGGLARRVRRRRAEPRLTVAVDIDSLYETLTGVGWYLYQVLDHLAQRDDLRLRLYGQGLAPAAAPGGAGGPPPPSLASPPAPILALPAGPAIEHVTYAAPDGLVIPPWRADQWLRRAAPLLMAADRNRVLFGPNFLLPPLFRFAAGARVVAIHDLAFRRLPWAVRPDTARALAERLERTLLEADLLLTDTQAVAGELAAAGVAPARVRAIHLGPGHLPPPSVLAAASPPAGTPDRYGLFVGTLEPRKNLPTLLTAWRELRRDAGAPPLLICGPRGWRARELRRLLAEAEAEGWLRYLGYVTPVELAALYRGAAVVALPSLYEGFGMPAVEAMAAGAPLVLSDLPVFHEVAGDAALYAPAGRPDLWRERLRQVLGDDSLRLDLARRGRLRAARFDWRRAAAATADAWRDAAGALPP